VRNTKYKSHYAVFSSLLLVCPWMLTFISPTYSQILSVYVLPFMWENLFHTHCKFGAKLVLYTFSVGYSTTLSKSRIDTMRTASDGMMPDGGWTIKDFKGSGRKWSRPKLSTIPVYVWRASEKNRQIAGDLVPRFRSSISRAEVLNLFGQHTTWS
jgi:hypothetical protein